MSSQSNKLKKDNRKESSEFSNIEEGKDNENFIQTAYSFIGTPIFKSHTLKPSISSHKIEFSAGDIPAGDLPIIESDVPTRQKSDETVFSYQTLELEGQLGLLDDEILEAFDIIKQIKCKQTSSSSVIPLPASIPHILCLDLDETLVYSVSVMQASKLKTSEYTPGTYTQYHYVTVRPEAIKFLMLMSKIYILNVFTSADSKYAAEVVNILDPDKKFFNKIYCRDSCLNQNGEYVKDLTILNTDLSSVVILDNSVVSFGLQLDNGIFIKPFHGLRNDCELLSYIGFLTEIANESDVRCKIELKYGLKKLYQHYQQCY